MSPVSHDLEQLLVRETIEHLINMIGLRRATYVSRATKESDLHRWASGRTIPDHEQMARIDKAVEIMDMVRYTHGDRAAKDWFVTNSIKIHNQWNNTVETVSPAQAIHYYYFDEATASATHKSQSPRK